MLVVVGLVFFHSAQIFYYADFFVKNEPPNIQSVSQLLSTLFVAFAGLWGMPLLSVNCIEFGRADVSVVKQEIV